MKLLRLRGRKVCDRVLAKGFVWKGRHMIVRSLTGPPRHPGVQNDPGGIYVGLLASTKLDKSAVKRNRMRRRCREALRLFVRESSQNTSPTLQLLISPRSSSLGAPFAELQQDIRNFLSTRSHGRSLQAR